MHVNNVNVLDAESVLVMVKLLVEVMKVKTLVLAVVYVLDSRVVKFHFSNDFLNVDLRTLTVKNMQS